MTLIKWNNEPKHSFPNIMENFFGKDIFDLISNNGHTSSLPAVNILEGKEDYRIEVAAPGLKKSDFHLDIENNLLKISAESHQDNTNKEEKYTRREFSYNTFQRAFTLPQLVETDKITAKYEDGILKIHIPKKEEAKEKPARTIKIS
jgi:HSP20 family protein